MIKIALISIFFFFINIAHSQTSEELAEKCKSEDQVCITWYMQQEFRKECESNKYSSCVTVGVRMQFIENEPINAAYFYSKGCEGGYLDSCNYLGELYEIENTVIHSYFDAYKIYKLNCQNNHLKSCTKQALLLKNGKGIRLDKKLAISLLEKACNGNEVIGCFNLAIFYENGDSIKTNKTKATDLFGKSCDLNYEDGCTNYARLIQLGIKQSPIENQSISKNQDKETTYDDLLECAAISYVGTAIFVPLEELDKIPELTSDLKLLISEQQLNFKSASDAFAARGEFYRELYLSLSSNKNYSNKDYYDKLEGKLGVLKIGIIIEKDYNKTFKMYNKCEKYIEEINKIKNNVKEKDFEKSIIKLFKENKIKNRKLTDKQIISLKIASINWKHNGFLTWNSLKDYADKKSK
jgi:TPR repeat protein